MKLNLLLLLCALLTLGSISSATEQPNIVLIFVDDLGWKDVGFNNNQGFIETPNLDRLRKEGMLFPAAYAAAGNCAPSRACLLSGKYGPRHGVYAVGDTDRGPKASFRLTPVPNTQELKPDFVTMAEALKAQGYTTGHFGKWHLGSDAKGTGPRQQGFDVSPQTLVAAGGGGEEDEGGSKAKNKKSKQEKKPKDKADPKRVFSITNAACDFIRQNKEKPFFAYLAHHAVHSALEARPETLAKFQTKAAQLTTPHVPALLAACIYDLDDAVGQLLNQLAELKLDQRTMVVFTSDNGGPPPADNEPLRGAKGAYYEGGIREPFLVRWPTKIQANSTCQTPIINLDLYPTFISAAGAKPTADLDGANLLPLMQGQPEAFNRSAIYWHFPGYLDRPVNRGRDPVFRTRPVSVIRKGDWKLHLYHEEWLLDGGAEKLASNNALELYNLATDLGEHTNLAQTEATRRDELLSDLLAWIKTTNAPLPTKR